MEDLISDLRIPGSSDHMGDRTAEPQVRDFSKNVNEFTREKLQWRPRRELHLPTITLIDRK
jgi:hypothetical protein